MLFASLVEKKIDISDRNRFLLGSILPDSYIDPSARKTAHFIKSIPEQNQLFFDFPCFLEAFSQSVLNDDLYLGYYAHLVEDAFYRFFLYYEKDFMGRISRYELEFLHNDYHILNSYIIGKYDMPKQLELPDNFEKESINQITEFDANRIISEYENDISENVTGNTTFLTESMLEEFVDKYIGLLSDELQSVRKGGSLLNPLDYKWENKK